MRIVVVGAAGTGGYFGGLLARAGEDVTFIARGAQSQALRTRGLTLKSRLAGTFTIPVQATDDPREAMPGTQRRFVGGQVHDRRRRVLQCACPTVFL
jgi:2-dehydropantoate 2-reductase